MRNFKKWVERHFDDYANLDEIYFAAVQEQKYAIVAFRWKLEPWQVHDLPEPVLHGPLTKEQAQLKEWCTRVEIELHAGGGQP